MKKNFLYLFTVLCTLSFFTACGDDDDPKVPENVLDVNAAYSEDKLALKYGDSDLLGKEVTFATEDGKTATITMKGLFSISDLMPKADQQAPAMAPGVIPGEVTTTLSDVKLTLSGEKYTFEGEYTGAAGVKASYSGEVQKDKLTMSVKANMPEGDLVGTTWALAPINPVAGTVPMALVWNSETPLKIDGSLIDNNIPVGTIIDVKVQDILAKYNVNMMVSGLLGNVIQSITYQNDGNIVASYKKMAATNWETSPINLAQYYIKDNKLFIQLNIANIMATVKANQSKAMATEPDLTTILGTLLSAGVPLDYSINNDALQVTAATSLILPLLKTATSDAIFPLIQAMLPETTPEIVKGLLPQIPGVVNGTKEISATLSLVKK